MWPQVVPKVWPLVVHQVWPLVVLKGGAWTSSLVSPRILLEIQILNPRPTESEILAWIPEIWVLIISSGKTDACQSFQTTTFRNSFPRGRLEAKGLQ